MQRLGVVSPTMLIVTGLFPSPDLFPDSNSPASFAPATGTGVVSPVFDAGTRSGG